MTLWYISGFLALLGKTRPTPAILVFPVPSQIRLLLSLMSFSPFPGKCVSVTPAIATEYCLSSFERSSSVLGNFRVRMFQVASFIPLFNLWVIWPLSSEYQGTCWRYYYCLRFDRHFALQDIFPCQSKSRRQCASLLPNPPQFTGLGTSNCDQLMHTG